MISIVCFAASYIVALCLEISRLFFRVRLRTAILIGFIAAGLLAHTIYLGQEARAGIGGGSPLSSWYHGCLILSWLLALATLIVAARNQPSAVGLIVLPPILALIAVAQIFPRTSQMSGETWHRVCSLCHGVALLIGTAAVMVGFVSGLLYLFQSYRLKNKILRVGGLRLPSLERLQRISENALMTSSVFLVIGLLSGLLLNLVRTDDAALPWTDPVVWPSGLLLIWLLSALAFNAYYKPARQGRKVAYLTFASFVFLGIVITILLVVPSSHGKSRTTSLAIPARASASHTQIGESRMGGSHAT